MGKTDNGDDPMLSCTEKKRENKFKNKRWIVERELLQMGVDH